jgi:hypothetical protein
MDFGLYYDGYEALCVLRSLRNRTDGTGEQHDAACWCFKLRLLVFQLRLFLLLPLAAAAASRVSFFAAAAAAAAAVLLLLMLLLLLVLLRQLLPPLLLLLPLLLTLPLRIGHPLAPVIATACVIACTAQPALLNPTASFILLYFTLTLLQWKILTFTLQVPVEEINFTIQGEFESG